MEEESSERDGGHTNPVLIPYNEIFFLSFFKITLRA